jgi:uncharacterized phage-associated protein
MNAAFAHRKATQALNFLARQAGGRINKLKALKLVFFADRYHLRKYGRSITNDRYFAMNYGPVPSGTKDIAEMGDFLGQQERLYAQQFLERDPADEHAFKSIGEFDAGIFSETDREALGFAARTFGRVDGFQLAELTHLYPEWKRHEAALESGGASRVPMCYEDFLDDPPAGVEPCHTLTDEERNDRREMLSEIRAFEQRWS